LVVQKKEPKLGKTGWNNVSGEGLPQPGARRGKRREAAKKRTRRESAANLADSANN